MDLEPREDDIRKGGDELPDLAEEDNSYNRRARTLIYVVAAGFFVVGGLNLAAYWVKCRREHVGLSIGHCLTSSIPIVIGVVILIMSSALARAIEEYLDE